VAWSLVFILMLVDGSSAVSTASLRFSDQESCEHFGRIVVARDLALGFVKEESFRCVPSSRT
jgi:hypothetical protein